MGWELGGRLKREGIYVHLWLIHVDAWQKPTQYWNYPSIKKHKLSKKKGKEVNQILALGMTPHKTLP